MDARVESADIADLGAARKPQEIRITSKSRIMIKKRQTIVSSGEEASRCDVEVTRKGAGMKGPAGGAFVRTRSGDQICTVPLIG